MSWMLVERYGYRETLIGQGSRAEMDALKREYAQAMQGYDHGALIIRKGGC